MRRHPPPGQVTHLSAKARPVLRFPDVLPLAISAFLADLGCQAVLAGFPLFLVLGLHAPVWLYGIAAALSYGGGAAMAYIGGRLGDLLGHRRVAIWGNALLPLLSLSALVPAALSAIALLTLGWWARDLRTPSRRAMLAQAVPHAQLGTAFGFLHALNMSGAMLAGLYILLAVLGHLSWRWIFLATTLPLAASTVALLRSGHQPHRLPPRQRPSGQRQPQAGLRTLVWATALYGFSSYSLGFPVLTVAQGAHAPAAGIAAFLVLQGVSAVTGYLLEGRLGQGLAERQRNLSLLGYLVAAVASGLLAAAYGLRLHLPWLFLGIVLLGFALAVVETLEPSLISAFGLAGDTGRRFGALSGARALGLLVANLALGLLYTLGAAYAYGYAALIAASAALLLLVALPAVRRLPAGA